MQLLQEFLSFQSKTVGYSAVATAQSDLSTFIKIDSVKVGDHPLVLRFMSGLFNLKPALPRYTETWNPQIVLNHLKTYPTTGNLSLKQLTQKLVMLMALPQHREPRLSKSYLWRELVHHLESIYSMSPLS